MQSNSSASVAQAPSTNGSPVATVEATPTDATPKPKVVQLLGLEIEIGEPGQEIDDGGGGGDNGGGGGCGGEPSW